MQHVNLRGTTLATVIAASTLALAGLTVTQLAPPGPSIPEAAAPQSPAPAERLISDCGLQVSHPAAPSTGILSREDVAAGLQEITAVAPTLTFGVVIDQGQRTPAWIAAYHDVPASQVPPQVGGLRAPGGEPAPPPPPTADVIEMLDATTGTIFELCVG